jgi:thiamine biosynthesis lipoprotein
MLHRLSFRAMGCEVVAFLESDSPTAPAFLDFVPEWFEEWEQTLSRFRPDSELTRLNQTFDQPVRVSDTLWEVFQYSLSANLMTNGLVTPTVLDAVVHAGYDRPFDSIAAEGYSSPAADPWYVNPLSLVIWDEKEQAIILPRGVHLDFGGVAKGWAAHQAMERLRALGPALVNAGGDIAVSGLRLGDVKWGVGVSNPFEMGTDLEVLYVKRCGVASSGKDRRRWMMGGVLHHHIINPQTGQPAVSDLLRVTAVAPTVMEAEAAAKAAFIMGSEKGLAWIEQDATLAAVLILDDGRVLHSQRVSNYL